MWRGNIGCRVTFLDENRFIKCRYYISKTNISNGARLPWVRFVHTSEIEIVFDCCDCQKVRSNKFFFTSNKVCDIRLLTFNNIFFKVKFFS